MMIYSPLRYPGGKNRLAPFILLRCVFIMELRNTMWSHIPEELLWLYFYYLRVLLKK